MKAAKYLLDIQRHADRARDYATGHTRETYLADRMVRDAMERVLQICGEAAWQLLKSNPSIAERLPRLQSLISFRHMLVHGYDQIDHGRVWEHLQEGLAEELHAAALLRQVDPEAPPDPQHTEPD